MGGSALGYKLWTKTKKDGSFSFHLFSFLPPLHCVSFFFPLLHNEVFCIVSYFPEQETRYIGFSVWLGLLGGLVWAQRGGFY